MTLPPFLKKGDIVAIVAPARSVKYSEVEDTIKWLVKEGFGVTYSPDLFDCYHQYAGEDIVRAADFQKFLDDDKVKAIICARGGYGSMRIIDKIDFTKFTQHPKWICGYSDITVFHAHIQAHCQIATLHCAMPFDFYDTSIDPDPIKDRHAASRASLISALKGEPLCYEIAPYPLNRQGIAEGILIGGNLSILYSLVGSKSFPDTEGKILFIEDVDEYLYHIDRMMLSLKRAGILSGLKGLIVGGFTNMNDNTIPFGKTAEEIIAAHCADYSFPILFNFPSGHLSPNLALRMGTPCSIVLSICCTNFILR